MDGQRPAEMRDERDPQRVRDRRGETGHERDQERQTQTREAKAGRKSRGRADGRARWRDTPKWRVGRQERETRGPGHSRTEEPGTEAQGGRGEPESRETETGGTGANQRRLERQ